MLRSLLVSSLLLPALALAGDGAPDPAVEVALAVLDTGLASEVLTREVSAVHTWLGGTRVRTRQLVFGLPVVASDVVVSLNPAGELVRVEGPTLDVRGFDPRPNVMLHQAEEAVVSAMLGLTNAEGLAWEPRTVLVAALDREQSLRLAYQVDLTTTGPFEGWQVLIDAHSGVIFAQRPTVHRADADVYETSPLAGDPIGVDLALIAADDTRTDWAVVRSCEAFGQQSGCTGKHQQAVVDEAGNVVFAPNPLSSDDPFAEIQMLYHLDLVGRWFNSHFGLQLGRIEGLVNFDYDNAFYGDADGDGIGEVAFGQNHVIDFAYDADVIYHEFGHAAFGAIVASSGFFDADEYGITYSAGSLNEGTADVFSMAITGDPQLGEYSGQAFAPASAPIRDLDKDLVCPDDLYGQTHADGEVWAAFGWKLISDERIGADLAGQLFWGALSSWPSDVSWRVAGDSMVTVSDDLLAAGAIDDATRAAIEEHIDATTLAGCGRVVALDAGIEPKQVMLHPGFFGPEANLPVQNQLSLEVSEYGVSLEIEVTDFVSNRSDLSWNLYVRRGEHIVHEFVDAGFGGFQRPQPAEYDMVFTSTDGSRFVFEVADPDFPEDVPELLLEPGETYYFSLASQAAGAFQGFGYAEITIRGEVEEVIPEETGRACGCATGGSSSGWWLLGLAAVGLRRRRG